MSDWLAELPPRARRGSRPRCLRLTEGEPTEVASRLSKIVQPYATIDHEHHQRLPRGRSQIEEAKLGETPGFLHRGPRETVTAWWLARTGGANTPNRDIAATATIEGSEGLVLVEAKAHESELDPRGRRARGNTENHERIGATIAEASAGLNALLPGWDLTIRSHYQLANRFVWAWKVASMGCPSYWSTWGPCAPKKWLHDVALFRMRRNGRTIWRATPTGLFLPDAGRNGSTLTELQ